MVRVGFARSPHAHARIDAIDAALAARGVLRVLTGAEIARVCTPWVGATPPFIAVMMVVLVIVALFPLTATVFL
jgi:CO/xanthine dehydrogenase Mo-binding subunit